MSDISEPDVVSVYPKLMWSPQGQEVTVQSSEEERTLRAEGYRLTQEAFTLKEPVVPDEPEPEIPHRKGRH